MYLNMTTLNNAKYLNESWRGILRSRLSENIMYINRIAKLKSTADPKKIEHFSSWKDVWWNEKDPIHGLHSYNPFRVQFVKDGLVSAGFKTQNSNLPLEGAKIVDIGCGGGILSESLAKLGAQVIGIDVSSELIDVAKEHIKLNPDISERVNYIHIAVEDFVKEERETYDAIAICEVLQYVTDRQFFLKECVKLVKPGKSIFITTLNKTVTSWLYLILACEYIVRCIPRGTFQWTKFVRPHEVQRILENYNFEIKSISGLKFNPLKTKQWSTEKWSLTSSTSTFYGIHAIRKKETDL